MNRNFFFWSYSLGKSNNFFTIDFCWGFLDGWIHSTYQKVHCDHWNAGCVFRYYIFS